MEAKVRSVVGDRVTREYLEATVQDLRQQIEKREASAYQVWQKDTSDLLEEIQRECNAVFERSKTRRVSPRTVLTHPFLSEPPNLQGQDEFLRDLLDENWGVPESDNDVSTPLSLPVLDQSLTDTEAMVRDL